VADPAPGSFAPPAILSSGRSKPRVALVHYWLVAMRGGERVLERLLGLYPDADILTHVYDPAAVSARIRAANVRTSFINQLPYARKLYQYYLPLMPMALEELDLSDYDLVISSEAGPAKGVITAPNARHFCYCHSPMRYIWDHYHQYRKEANLLARMAMPTMYHRLREWDVSSSARVDHFAANSSFIQQRIRKFWRREAEVIHPRSRPACSALRARSTISTCGSARWCPTSGLIWRSMPSTPTACRWSWSAAGAWRRR
jgi:hypothetical protein